MRNYYELEAMKYWAPTFAMTPETKRQHLEQMINSGEYIFSRKWDGNFTKAVISSERSVLQTRGISKVTGTFSELQDKVFFWEDVVNAFQSGTTVLLGELVLPGGIDRDVGAIARCLTEKAIARQKDKKLEWYIFDVLAYDGIDLIDTPIEQRITYISDAVKRINNPLVHAVKYYPMDEKFFDILNDIFRMNGEGVVCYKKGITYTPGKRSSAWTTCKVKQEISTEIDCFIINTVPPIRDYTGKDMATWTFWENEKTGERLIGELYEEYILGKALRPITKGYYYGWPGAITVGVYDKNNNIYELCNVAGLTEEFKEQLKNNFQEWYMCPVTIGGMMVSDTKTSLSIRHPYLRSIRKNDIDIKDCTLEKILS